jgi:hypothetical protein
LLTSTAKKELARGHASHEKLSELHDGMLVVDKAGI